MKRYIPHSHVQGTASRQAHADMPAGTYEREISKEGFFGPAAHLHHRHPPTGWVGFEGPLQPHALDCARLESPDAVERMRLQRHAFDCARLESPDAVSSPWNAPELLANA